MTPFEHLAVFVSIVLGLGVAHLLSAAMVATLAVSRRPAYHAAVTAAVAALFGWFIVTSALELR